MPLKKGPDGAWIRVAYQPGDYAIPARELAALQACPYGTREELAKHDGLYMNYDRVRELDRDGAPWVLLVERSKGWLIEVLLADDPPATIVPMPPEEAWRFARERDAGRIAIEGAPPPGVVDPYPPPPR